MWNRRRTLVALAKIGRLAYRHTPLALRLLVFPAKRAHQRASRWLTTDNVLACPLSTVGHNGTLLTLKSNSQWPSRSVTSGLSSTMPPYGLLNGPPHTLQYVAGNPMLVVTESARLLLDGDRSPYSVRRCRLNVRGRLPALLWYLRGPTARARAAGAQTARGLAPPSFCASPLCSWHPVRRLQDTAT